MVRPSQRYWAKRAASTPTWAARKRTTSGAASCLERKKRPSYCKHLSKTANPRRVAPDLLPIATSSSGRSVKCSNNSSAVHVRFMRSPFACHSRRVLLADTQLFCGLFSAIPRRRTLLSTRHHTFSSVSCPLPQKKQHCDKRNS